VIREQTDTARLVLWIVFLSIERRAMGSSPSKLASFFALCFGLFFVDIFSFHTWQFQRLLFDRCTVVLYTSCGTTINASPQCVQQDRGSVLICFLLIFFDSIPGNFRLLFDRCTVRFQFWYHHRFQFWYHH
jgi:hypothetical protein